MTWWPSLNFNRCMLAILILVSWAPDSMANEHWGPLRVKDIGTIGQSIFAQDHYYVPGAEIAEINLVALRRDFKHMRSWSDAQIREWVLSRYSRMSALQLRLRGIRVDMFTFDPNSVAHWYHPFFYKRAAVDEVKDGEENVGVIDVKGTGHADEKSVLAQVKRFESLSGEDRQALNELRTEDHSDGMMSLGEAISESIRQKAVQAGFDIYNAEHYTSWQTVETYFILKLPIKILRDDGKWDWAAVYGRQGHWRGDSGLPSPESVYTDPFGGKQATIFDGAVDFGGVMIHQPELLSTFGDPQTFKNAEGMEDAQLSNSWKYAHETARAEDIEAAVRAHIVKMLGPIQTRLAALPSLSDAEEKARDIVFRLRDRSAWARVDMIKHYVRLDKATILKTLKLVLRTEKTSAPISSLVNGLLQRPDFAVGTTAYRILLTRLRAIDNLRTGNEQITELILEHIRDQQDGESLEYLRKILVTSESRQVRERVITQLKKRSADQLVTVMPSVFASASLASTGWAPLTQHLLDQPEFAKSYPDWYRYIVNQMSLCDSRRACFDVFVVLLDHLAKTNPPAFEERLMKVLGEGDRHRTEVALHILLNLDTATIWKMAPRILAGGDVGSKISFLAGLARRPEVLTEKAAIFADFLKRELTSLQPMCGIGSHQPLRRFREIIELVPDQFVKMFEAEFLFLTGMNVYPVNFDAFFSVVSKSSRAALARAMLQDKKRAAAHLMLLQTAIDNTAELLPEDAFDEIYLLAFENPMRGNFAIEFVRQLVLMAKSADHFRRSHLSPEILLHWIETQDGSISRAATLALASYPFDVLAPLFDRILAADRTGYVRAVFAEALLNNGHLPAGSNLRYEFLEKLFQYSVRMGSQDLRGVLEILKVDHDPRAKYFVDHIQSQTPCALLLSGHPRIL